MKTRFLLVVAWIWASAFGRADDFEFVVVGDTRPRFESEDFRNFGALIERINALQPAFVVNVGDLIYGYGPRSKEGQWDKYQQVIKSVRVPYHQLPGNHDTHSKAARRVYERRFGQFYHSFDYGGCHFVCLDNNEQQRWGYIGPEQLAWLEADLKQTSARSVFVFLHFPIWEPERLTPKYYDLWLQTLHPLFRQYRVRAVFGGHFHSYGPTREFDGIRYFITGGGGAELRPDYKKSGGEHHFMRVRVSENSLTVRVVTERGEMTDAEADVMGGLLFADRHSSRIGVTFPPQDLAAGASFSISVDNPYRDFLTGTAQWVYDASAFSVQPAKVSLQIPSGGTQRPTFELKALKATVQLESLPHLEFNLLAEGRRHRFHRDLLFLQKLKVPYRNSAPLLDGRLEDWTGLPVLELSGGTGSPIGLRAVRDRERLYLAVTLPAPKAQGKEEFASGDDLQIGLAGRLGETDFGADLIRLGFTRASGTATDRTPGQKMGTIVRGVRSACGTQDDRTTYEIGVPLRLLKSRVSLNDNRLVLNLSFPLPDGAADAEEPTAPSINSLFYKARYGTDSLVPVHFVELTLEKR